jgi:hypothetical protein
MFSTFVDVARESDAETSPLLSAEAKKMGAPRLILLHKLTHEHAQGSGPTPVRAATAPDQRRKWTLERSRFGADYVGNITEW